VRSRLLPDRTAPGWLPVRVRHRGRRQGHLLDHRQLARAPREV